MLLGSGVGTVADGWLPKPQVGSLNPVIGKILYITYIKTKIKKKEAVKCQFLK